MRSFVIRRCVLGCLAILFVAGCEEIGSLDSEDLDLEERAASTGHKSNTLLPGDALTVNQYLLSKDSSHRFYLQSDGNLVLRRISDQKALWSSGTHGKSATRLKLQADGNLVLYTASGRAVWSSNTAGSGATRLYLHSAGRLVLYRNSSVVWNPDGAPKPTNDDDGIVASNSRSTLLVHEGAWKYVYCSGSAVKVSSASSKKQRWVKRGSRTIYNETVKKYLYCPERDGGYAPTECECSNGVENYHQKTSATGGSAPATISLNRNIYIAPNNNMNACLKVIRGDQVHSPCAIEPWRNQTCRRNNGHYFSDSEHAKACARFRLND